MPAIIYRNDVFQLGYRHKVNIDIIDIVITNININYKLNGLNLKQKLITIKIFDMNDKLKNKKLTTASGKPYAENENSMSIGPRGPLLLQDFILHEKMAHFNRERIPERVVHAKGSGAFGTFTVTHDITKYTKAKIFSAVGKQTKMLARFSTVGGEKGSADTERDPRGFALKFYTEEGNYDIVGNNLPVFFIRDAMKFPDMVHSLKPSPVTNKQDPNRIFDFFSHIPESTNMFTYLYSDAGIPATYRNMNGSSVHAFKWVNTKGEVEVVQKNGTLFCIKKAENGSEKNQEITRTLRA